MDVTCGQQCGQLQTPVSKAPGPSSAPADRVPPCGQSLGVGRRYPGRPQGCGMRHTRCASSAHLPSEAQLCVPGTGPGALPTEKDPQGPLLFCLRRQSIHHSQKSARGRAHSHPFPPFQITCPRSHQREATCLSLQSVSVHGQGTTEHRGTERPAAAHSVTHPQLFARAPTPLPCSSLKLQFPCHGWECGHLF